MDVVGGKCRSGSSCNRNRYGSGLICIPASPRLGCAPSRIRESDGKRRRRRPSGFPRRTDGLAARRRPAALRQPRPGLRPGWTVHGEGGGPPTGDTLGDRVPGGVDVGDTGDGPELLGEVGRHRRGGGGRRAGGDPFGHGNEVDVGEGPGRVRGHRGLGRLRRAALLCLRGLDSDGLAFQGLAALKNRSI